MILFEVAKRISWGHGLCKNHLLCVTFNFGQRSWFPCGFTNNSNPLSFPGKNSYHRHFFKRPCGIKYFEKNARSYAHDQAEVKIEKSYPRCYPVGNRTQIEHSMATSQIKIFEVAVIAPRQATMWICVIHRALMEDFQRNVLRYNFLDLPLGSHVGRSGQMDSSGPE